MTELCRGTCFAGGAALREVTDIGDETALCKGAGENSFAADSKDGNGEIPSS